MIITVFYQIKDVIDLNLCTMKKEKIQLYW